MFAVSASQRTLCAPRLSARNQRAKVSPVVRAEAGENQEQPSSPASAPSKSSKDDELPPWVRREKEREAMKDQPKDLPFGVYLLFSSFVAIAAVGSIFEYANKNPIFGVVQPDSPLYLPILGIFGITGFPTAGYLFFKAVSKANELADAMDRADN